MTSENASYEAKPLTGSQKQAPLSAGQVLSVLGSSDFGRAYVMARFRGVGGSLDRWARRDREVIANAITAAEGALELAAHGRMNDTRRAYRAVRRQLETELWP